MAEYKQKLILTDRSLLEIKGVTKVENFDNNKIQLVTNLGDLQVEGADLDICHLNLEGEEIAIKGEVSSLIYKNSRDSLKSGKKIISRLLK